MSKNGEVIIIGGGVIGCAAAYYLAKQGVSVLVLEERMIGHGGSSRNGGGVRQSARDVRELPIAMYGIKNLWPTLSEELGVDVEYHQDGNLRLAKTEKHIDILQNLVDNSRKSGLEVTMISGGQARELCPYMSEEVIAASWCPTDGHANPMLTTLAYYRKARMMGVHFITGEKVVKLKKAKGRIRKVLTQSGNVYEADTVILAAGFPSRAIANTVGIDIPMFKELNECLVTEMQPPMFWQMLGTAEADFYGHQTKHGSFVFGGSSGMEYYYRNQADFAHETSITPASVCRGIMKYFPALSGAKIIRNWAGWIDVCADRVPVIGRVEEVPGLILACGFSGHGFGIAPAVGQILMEIVLEKPVCVDISPLKYDRFHAKA